jgi:hypothetical protein
MRWLLILPLVWTTGCAMPLGQGVGERRLLRGPVQLAQDVRGRVWERGPDGAWRLSEEAVVVPAGWYALPDPALPAAAQ